MGNMTVSSCTVFMTEQDGKMSAVSMSCCSGCCCNTAACNVLEGPPAANPSGPGVELPVTGRLS